MAVAKRHPNDRNEKAVQKAKRQAENLDEFTLRDGLVVKLRDIDPLFLSSVMATVEHPKRPVYEVTTASGRIEEYPMDEMVAEQSPELKPLWDKYQLESAQASGEQLTLMIRTILLDGTVMPENWRDEQWERRMKIIGVKLPADPEERWVFYLESKMTTAEKVALNAKVMRRTGVPEEYIADAEESFRDSLPDERGRPGDVADANADSRGDAQAQAG